MLIEFDKETPHDVPPVPPLFLNPPSCPYEQPEPPVSENILFKDTLLPIESEERDMPVEAPPSPPYSAPQLL